MLDSNDTVGEGGDDPSTHVTFKSVENSNWLHPMFAVTAVPAGGRKTGMTHDFIIPLLGQ